MENTGSTDMSFVELSAIGARAQRSEISGTSFLDLPPELREMIYDLCAPKAARTTFYDLPLQSKPEIMGINLLRCSKQIHNEVSRRLRLWESTWFLRVEHSIDLNCSFAMFGLHDLAVAKIDHLYLSFHLDTSSNTTFDIRGLEALLKLRSLNVLVIIFYLDTGPTGSTIEEPSDIENMPLITGLVMRVLSHVPASVWRISWHLKHPSIPIGQYCDLLDKLAKKYKSLRGSAYTIEQNSGSSSNPIEISASRHI
jgi:hypothetical protein